MLSKRERHCYWIGSWFGIVQFPIAMILLANGVPRIGAAFLACLVGIFGYRAVTWALGGSDAGQQATK